MINLPQHFSCSIFGCPMQKALFAPLVVKKHFLIDIFSHETSIFVPRSKNHFLISSQKIGVSREKKSLKNCPLTPAYEIAFFAPADDKRHFFGDLFLPTSVHFLPKGKKLILEGERGDEKVTIVVNGANKAFRY